MKLIEAGTFVLVLSTINMVYHQYFQPITKEYILGMVIGGFVLICVGVIISLCKLNDAKREKDEVTG